MHSIRPAFISIEGLQIAEGQRATVKGIFQVAITKQNKDSSLPISLSNNIQLSVPDAIIFPIDNAPSFTPTNLLRKDGSIRLLGYLEAPGIGGRFYLSGEGKSYDDANVEIGSSGLRVRGANWAYTLNPIKDSNGNSRPITLFKLGGLSFEAPSGSTAKLISKDADRNDFLFEALGENILVTAPFDGGKLSLRLSNTGESPNFPKNVPIYTASLRTGKVTLTPKIEFASFEIGGMVIPASDRFKMTYDPVAEKFSFTINNLSVESLHPTGIATPQARVPGVATLTQTFDLSSARETEVFVQNFGPGANSNDVSFTNTSGVTAETIRKAVIDVVNDSKNTLKDVDRDQIRIQLKVTVQNRIVTITGVPFVLRFLTTTETIRTDYQGALSNPVKMTIPSGSISLTKGKLDPITSLGVGSFEIGQTLVNSFDGGVAAYYEPIKPTTAGEFKPIDELEFDFTGRRTQRSTDFRHSPSSCARHYSRSTDDRVNRNHCGRWRDRQGTRFRCRCNAIEHVQLDQRFTTIREQQYKRRR